MRVSGQFYFFYEKISHVQKRTKSIKSIKSLKSIKSIKSTKRQTNDFLILRCFYAHKNAVFSCFTHRKAQKAQKAHKKHKNANKRTSDFLPLRCFLSAFKTAFFVFVRLCAFLCFSCVWNLFVKEIKLPWYPHLYYYYRIGLIW